GSRPAKASELPHGHRRSRIFVARYRDLQGFSWMSRGSLAHVSEARTAVHAARSGLLGRLAKSRGRSTNERQRAKTAGTAASVEGVAGGRPLDRAGADLRLARAPARRLAGTSARRVVGRVAPGARQVPASRPWGDAGGPRLCVGPVAGGSRRCVCDRSPAARAGACATGRRRLAPVRVRPVAGGSRRCVCDRSPAALL